MEGLESPPIGRCLDPMPEARHETDRPRTASPIFWSIWPSRAPSGATRLQIAEEIEDVGGYINAYTSREMTAYYARVLGA